MSTYSYGNACSAINCSNNQRNSPDLSFFRFPKDQERSKKWLINSRRDDLSTKDVLYLYNNIKFCSIHFEDDQFMNCKRKKLVWNAVPTLFYVPSKPHRTTLKRKRKLPTRIDAPVPNKHKLPKCIDGVDPVPTCSTEDPCTYSTAFLTVEYPEFLKTEPYDMDVAEDSTSMIDGSGDMALQQEYSNVIKTEALSPVETYKTEDCIDGEYSSQHMETKTKPEAVYLIMPKVKMEYSDNEESQEVNIKTEEVTVEFPNIPTEEPGEDESYPKLQNREEIQGWNVLQSSYLAQLFKTQGPVKLIPGQVNKCYICAKEFQQFCQLKRHAVVHLGKTFACDVCFARFARKGNLEIHKLVHSGARKHVCPICNKNFKTTSNLKTHSLIHTGERKYSCSMCPRQFIFRQHFVNHQLVHTKEKKFKCSICGSHYARRSYLRIHLLRHAGQKNYFCSVCNKGFLEKHRVKLHSVVHTKEKRYTCSICEKKFKRSNSLKAHLINIHERTHKSPEVDRKSSPDKQCPVSAAAQ